MDTINGVLRLNVSLQRVFQFHNLVAGAEFNDDTRRLLAVGDLGALVDGVERLEVQKLKTGTGPRSITKGANNRKINSILILSARSVGSEKNNIVGREGAVRANGLSVNSGLVGRQSTSLVRAENSDTSELLDGGDTGDDGLVLSKLLSTNGKSDRQDSWHGNWNTTDQEYKDVVQTMTVFVAETSIENKDLGNDENTNGVRAERTDLSQDLLQVTSRVIVLADKGSGTTEESVGTCTDHDTLGFSLLVSRATDEESNCAPERRKDSLREALITILLGLRKRFTGQSSLVDGNVDYFCETAMVAG